MRIAPNELSFATLQAHRDIYAAPWSRSRKPLLKSPTFYNNGRAPDVFFETDPAKHAKLRRLLAPGFRPAALKAQEHVIHRYVDLLVDKVGRLTAEEGAVDMAQAFPWLTFDIMGTYVSETSALFDTPLFFFFVPLLLLNNIRRACVRASQES